MELYELRAASNAGASKMNAKVRSEESMTASLQSELMGQRENANDASCVSAIHIAASALQVTHTWTCVGAERR